MNHKVDLATMIRQVSISLSLMSFHKPNSYNFVTMINYCYSSNQWHMSAINSTMFLSFNSADLLATCQIM